MRVLQVIPTLQNGGAERFVCELTNALNRVDNVNCNILTLFDPTAKFEQLASTLSSDVHCYSLGKKMGFDASMFNKLYRFVHNEYDVVHAHIGAIKYLFQTATFQKSIRHIATIHSEASREAGTSIDKWSRKFMFKRGLVTPVCISEESQDSFQSFYHMSSPLIYNGVSSYRSTSNFKIDGISKDDIVFIHPASCQPVKNQELLFKAFTRFSKIYPMAKLIWLGRTDSYPDLFEQLKGYFSNNIRYGGVIENVRDYLSVAHAMCLSSEMEGMPMTVIEAMSVGCIPIVTPVGGCKNMVEDGINGFVSASLKEDDYFNALVRCMEMSKETEMSMRHSATSSFEKKFKIDSTAKEYLRVYTSKF